METLVLLDNHENDGDVRGYDVAALLMLLVLTMMVRCWLSSCAG